MRGLALNLSFAVTVAVLAPACSNNGSAARDPAGVGGSGSGTGIIVGNTGGSGNILTRHRHHFACG